MKPENNSKSIQEYKSIEDVIEKAKQALNVPFKKFDKHNRLLTKSKGNIGNIVEEGIFGYHINSDQRPDFPHLGLELKVTPYKYTKKKQISAKERLVLTMIDYMEDYKVPFRESNCMHKLNKILMLFYNHDFNVPKSDYYISKIYLYLFDQLPQKDRIIIENDYNTIINKIKTGHAEDISEGDTFYLGACTKGSTALKSLTTQAFSDKKAKKRAFSLKTSYMTQLLRSDIFNNSAITEQSLITNLDELSNHTIKEIIENRLKPYHGKTLSEIDTLHHDKINRSSKSYLRTYISRILKNTVDNAEDLDEFKKANIKIKTIRRNKNGTIRESMSFPCFKFSELIQQEWYESDIREQFANEKYLFCVFDEVDDSNHEYTFRKAFLWSMPEKILDNEVKEVWEDTKKKAIEGIQFNIFPTSTGSTKITNNLINKSDNMIVHIRPHSARAFHIINGVQYGNGSMSRDGDELPNGDVITKQCFWINNDFIVKVINDNLNDE
ncbi:DNA mismatch repair protein MutH [Kandleria vitulina]|uniref:Sau3AI family type II restriction endonuclease n=1 Tax=Kandleria vitulina TaxID=1630 RepID=UPI00088CA1D1|nr:Sau3AI family type II restriction endonuclease [Kandleria vitulina]SDL90848.1 DNA mismatch repair protein MutH [Kandleria vitulina]